MTDFEFFILLSAAYIAPHMPKNLSLIISGVFMIAATVKGLLK